VSTHSFDVTVSSHDELQYGITAARRATVRSTPITALLCPAITGTPRPASLPLKWQRPRRGCLPASM